MKRDQPQTARGDITGTIFDHLLAYPALLIHCLSSMPTGIRGVGGALPDFLVEYYFYTAAVSLVSIQGGQQTSMFAKL
ncbi:hypothetical protein SLS55_008436 [Diplodia seriata]|uniref:Uncharacterized protein n=1 Tax=Diplodia seriata TaxID=420778 RepID=A0ABR3CAF7_9PEZI